MQLSAFEIITHLQSQGHLTTPKGVIIKAEDTCPQCLAATIDYDSMLNLR